jgi:hypothetical protein
VYNELLGQCRLTNIAYASSLRSGPAEYCFASSQRSGLSVIYLLN